MCNAGNAGVANVWFRGATAPGIGLTSTTGVVVRLFTKSPTLLKPRRSTITKKEIIKPFKYETGFDGLRKDRGAIVMSSIQQVKCPD